MARGDGKAVKGRTKGSSIGVKRMSLGGFMGGKPSGGNQSPSGSMGGFGGQASGAGAGGAGGGGGNSLGASSRDGGFGGVDPGYPDDRRPDLRGNPNTTTRTESMSSITSPDSMKARLGPNAAQAMVEAGVSPEWARSSADTINKRASEPRSILGDPKPGQRLATANRDGSFSYAPVPGQVKTKQIYDQILPERKFPEAAPVGTLGSFGTASTTATPKSPMAVYGDEFSFTPEQTTKAFRSMYDAKLPGASYNELMGFKKAMKDPENKAMASALSAPFSSKTRAPVKSISEKIPQDPSYSSKYQESLLGTNEPVVSSPDAAKNTTLYKTSLAPVKPQPQTRSVGTQTPPNVQLPKPRPEGLSTAKAPTTIANTKKATPKEGSVFVKDGVRYQIRGGKAYNFNVPGGSKRGKPEKDRRFGEREPGGLRNRRDGGVVRKTDGAATRGKTRGRYI